MLFVINYQLSMSDKSNSINFQLSRMYIYFNSRFIDNNKQLPISDTGASMKSVYEAIIDYKITSELIYPYEIEKCNSIPPKAVYDNAMRNKNPIFNYRRIIPCMYSIKYIISVLKLPIMAGMSVYENFTELSKNNDVLDKPEGQFLGLHAILITGYNDDDKTVTILNSHGTEFGDGGFFRMSYNYLLNANLTFEFWVVNSN